MNINMVNYCPAFATNISFYGVNVLQYPEEAEVTLINNPSQIIEDYYSDEPDISGIVRIVETLTTPFYILSTNPYRTKELLPQYADRIIDRLDAVKELVKIYKLEEIWD